jgi:hypothetical protein
VEVDEYQILNIMRWFGGFEEKHVRRVYHSNLLNLKCTCSHHLHSDFSTQREASVSRQQGRKLGKVKSERKLARDGKYLLASFFRYVETIIKSERRLNILREGIRGYRRETE